ncbi:hypothetical protein [Microlunatus sp. Y2014]|uniref:hypothetical protein n=1 Tax=Microlunatus sp. Y2014 TaxID=3418488 RepID=UPI003DA796AD
MMMQHDGGGGGGSSYSLRTHRELNAYVGSASRTDLETLRRNWRDSAHRAHTMADLIEAKLADLTAEGGWTGSGAETFAQVIRHDLIANLRAYARRAGGYTPEGHQNVSHASDVEAIQEAVGQSYNLATNNNIPWDVDTTWQVRRKEVDQSLFGKIDELVTGEDEEYEKAKSNSPYEIMNGRQSLVREVPKPEFEAVQNGIPANPSSPVFSRTNTNVSPVVDRFDRTMEGLNIGTNPRANVYGGVVDVEAALRNYAPQEVQRAGTTNTTNPGETGGSVGFPGGPQGPGGGGGTNVPNPNTPGDGGGGNGGGTGGNTGPDFGGPGTGGNEGPDFEVGPPGIGGPGTGGGGPDFEVGPPGTGGPGTGGGGPDFEVGPPGTGGPGTGGGGPDFEVGGPGEGGQIGGVETGTGAAGVTPVGTGPGAGAGIGGIGGIGGTAGPAGPGAVNVGATPGAGGLGSLAPGAVNAGKPGTSFSVGADGRPMLNAGNVGGLPGARAGAGMGGPGGPGAGAGGDGAGGRPPGAGGGPGAGGAPMAGNRRGQRSGDGEEEQDGQVDETWLEEDRSVWGNRAAAPPHEIR